MNFKSIVDTWREIRFSTKVIIVFAFINIVVISIFSTFLITTEIDIVKSDMAGRSSALVDHFANNADYALFLEDMPDIERLGEALMKDEGVSFVDIRNVNGKVLLRKKKDHLSIALVESLSTPLPGRSRPETSIREEDDLLCISKIVWSPVERDIWGPDSPMKPASRNPAGKITIGFSLKKSNDLIRNAVVSTFVLAVGVTVVSIVLVLIIARRSIDPLSTLVKGTKELASGNLAHRVHIRRRDEIGELANAFNSMAERIENSHKMLEEHNLRLEEAVLKRTTDLVRRNKRIINHQRVLLELQKKPFEDLSSMLGTIAETAALNLDVEMANVWLFSKDRSESICEDTYIRNTGSHIKGDRCLIGKYPKYFKLLEHNRAMAVDDALHDERLAELIDDFIAPRKIASVLLVPIYTQGEMIGILCLEHQGVTRHWTLEEQEFASAMAVRVSLAVEAAQRRDAELALRASEERYRTIFDSTGTAMIVIDPNGLISLANTEFETLFGYRKEDIEGKMNIFSMVFPEDFEKLQNHQKQWRANPLIEPRNYEIRGTDCDGRVKDLLVTVTTLPGIDRRISSIIDITELKRLENALHQARKMEAIGTLAGGIAHDFNNLLMGIQGYVSLILLKMNNQDPHYEKLRRIEEHVQSGADLTRQVLGFARGGKYEIKTTNLNDILEKTSAMFGRTKKEIRMEKRYQQDLWAVDIDRGQIEQVLLNLYVNAWQAMPGGGVIYLESSNIFLDEHYSDTIEIHPGCYVKISITDTGIGMDAQTRERVFEPFFTTKEMGRGTGLGLATVYGIIKGHRGIINVYSEKGQGTSFHFYLPVSDRDIIKDNPQLSELKEGHETILLVDDEPSIIDVSREFLETLGYSVLVAEDGQKAIDICMSQNNTVDLVILDMIMPGMSGGETFDALRKLYPDIRVILSSGYSLDGMARQIMERGCRSFIQKPFTIYQLSQKVREALNAS